MPNPNPKPGPHLWKPGESGNPGGSSAKQRNYSDIARRTAAQLAEVGSVICNGTMADLGALKGKKDTSVLKVWVATLVLNSMKRGDSSTFDRLMNRIVGKVKETVHIEGPGAEALASMSPEQVKAAARAEIAHLQLVTEEVGDD